MKALRSLLVLVGLWVACGGCARYQVGVNTLYDSNIRTVYVPMFTSASYRRNLGELLTEAVIKEIEQRTTFKVVHNANADSILTGRIVGETKSVRIENRNDDPRELQYEMVVEVTWQDRRGELIMQRQLAVPPELVDAFERARIVPEVGQSTTTAQVQIARRLATQIVDLMETPWGDEVGPAFLP
jgi:hypothetical protein